MCLSVGFSCLFIIAGDPADVQTRSLNVDLLAQVKRAWDGLMALLSSKHTCVFFVQHQCQIVIQTSELLIGVDLLHPRLERVIAVTACDNQGQTTSVGFRMRCHSRPARVVCITPPI